MAIVADVFPGSTIYAATSFGMMPRRLAFSSNNLLRMGN